MADIGTATNKKLLDVFNMMKDGSLILRPSFQRKLVWNDNHKENFIETVLNKLPFPEVYFADGDIDLETQTSKTLVVDGQQRLSTIYQYIKASSEFSIKRIKKFAELTPDEKTDFFDYKIVVRDLGRINMDVLIEIFQRINSVNYALNAMEIKNALYEGEFISLAKDFIENNKNIDQIEVFSTSELTRMKDIEYILLIMSTLEEGGYFTGSKEIETYVEKYDSNYPNKVEMKNDLNSVIQLFVDSKFDYDSIWYRKSSFFTLIIELIKFKRNYGLFPNAKPLSNLLKKFESELLANKTEDITKNRFAEYYYYTFQGTTSRKGRNLRGNLLAEYLENLK